jgi:DNA-binding NtrC family response regulator
MAKARTKTASQRSRAVSPAFKALIHQEAGAGRSKVTRKFFGLSEREQGALTDLVAERITRNLRKTV